MNKDMLRDLLFQKYFENDDGILVSDLTFKLSFIPELYNRLHILCSQNIKHFNLYSFLERIKMIEHNHRQYLILKLRMWEYVIIDIDKKENISVSEFIDIFDENFFVSHFNERKEKDGLFLDLYTIIEYNGNIQELIDFYKENYDILCLSNEIYCKFIIGNAWTYFHLDFVNSQVQIGFQTYDQSLYERLFLKYDLTPASLQDAQSRIGLDKMNEMFEKIKDIKIPVDAIPNDLYQLYLNNCDIRVKLKNKIDKHS